MSEIGNNEHGSRELQVLDKLGEIEKRCSSEETLLAEAMDSLLTAVHMDGGVVVLCEESAPDSPPVINKPVDYSGPIVINGPDGPATDALLNHQKEVLNWCQVDSVQVAHMGNPPHTWVVVPLPGKRARVGTLVLAATGGQVPQEREVELLRVAGQRIGLSIGNLRLHQSSQKRVAQLAAVNHIVRAISSTLDIDQVYATLFLQLQQVLGFDWAALGLLNDARQTVLQTSVGQPLVNWQVGCIVAVNQAPLGWAGHQQRALLRRNIQSSDPAQRFDDDSQLLKAGLRTDLTVPLFLGERCIGAISLASQEENPYTSSDLQILRQAGEQVAIAVENARMYAAEQERAQKLIQVSELVRNVASALDVDRQVQEIARAQALFPQGTFIIGMLNGGTIRWSPADQTVPKDLDPLVERVLATGESQLWIHNAPDPAMLAVPLRTAGQVIGVLALHGAPGESFSRTELQLLETLSVQASVTLENARLFEMTLRQGALLEQRANRLAHLLETSYHVLRLSPQTKALLKQICHIAQDALDFERVGLYLLDEQTDKLSLRAASGLEASGVHASALGSEAGANASLLAQTCSLGDLDRLLQPPFRVSRSYHVRYRDPALETVSSALPCLAPHTDCQGEHCYPSDILLTPIETPAGQVVGYFTLSRPRDDRAPTLETVQTVEIFVNQVAIALENARLFAALEERLNQARRVNELAALNRLSTAVASSLEVESILKAAVHEIARTLRPDISALWLLPVRQEPSPPQAVHYLRGTDKVSPSSLVSARLLGTVIQDGQSLRFSGLDAYRDKTGPQQISHLQDNELDLAENLSSAMLAPMVVRDQKIGIIGVFARQKEAFDDRDLTLLDSMASAVAMAIENARLYAESKNFATELAASQAQLIQSAKLAATGKLAASIAHEINNPLQAVQSCVYLIADGAPPDDPNVKYVNIAREELDRIARIVGRMLSFHQPTTDAKEPTDINDLIENILALVHKRLQHSKIVVETELATDLPAVHTVRDHIKQVLLNLFLNALEAMPQGGTLRIQTANAAHKWVTVAIQDNGIGIQPEDITHLFDPFYTTKTKGTGLGLSISYDIVAQHGGEILVDSEPGKGTTFTIRLPSQKKGANVWKNN